MDTNTKQSLCKGIQDTILFLHKIALYERVIQFVLFVMGFFRSTYA